jgi:hypothetical protein
MRRRLRLLLMLRHRLRRLRTSRRSTKCCLFRCCICTRRRGSCSDSIGFRHSAAPTTAFERFWSIRMQAHNGLTRPSVRVIQNQLLKARDVRKKEVEQSGPRVVVARMPPVRCRLGDFRLAWGGGGIEEARKGGPDVARPTATLAGFSLSPSESCYSARFPRRKKRRGGGKVACERHELSARLEPECAATLLLVRCCAHAATPLMSRASRLQHSRG